MLRPDLWVTVLAGNGSRKNVISSTLGLPPHQPPPDTHGHTHGNTTTPVNGTAWNIQRGSEQDHDQIRPMGRRQVIPTAMIPEGEDRRILCISPL
jgi:hypothetical protein